MSSPRLSRAASVALLFVVLAAPPRPARGAEAAEEAPPLLVVATPFRPYPGAPETLLRVRWDAAVGVTDWVADRRLLSFELERDRGRRVRCRHPDAPSRVDGSRVRHAAPPDEAADLPPVRSHEEWVDLRMYCWGARLDALREGGTLRVRYGFPRRGRDRWVARTEGDAAHEVEGPVLRFDGAAAAASSPSAGAAPEGDGAEGPAPAAPPGEAAAGPAVQVELLPEDTRRFEGLVFRVRLRSDEPRWVYFRDDLLRFRVRGPLGERHCVPSRTEVVPILELFDRLGGARRVATWVSADVYCEASDFPLAGVYDVVPEVDLVYDGAEAGREATVGTFAGPAAPVRVRHDPGGYVEHTLDHWTQPPGVAHAPD